MKFKHSKEFTIGLSVLVALVILIAGIDFLKGINIFKPSNFYYASYDNVAGLETAAPVMIDGYKVGQVREIQFDYENHGKIRVLLSLNKKLRLPSDSKAIIASNFLSGAYIEIHPGSRKTFIEVGGDVPTAVSPDMLSTLTDEVMPKIGGILPKVDSLLHNLNQLVSDPALSASIGRLDGISDNLLVTSAGIRTTFGSQVPLLMRNAGHVVNNLDTVSANLSLLTHELNALPISSTMSNVEQITNDLARFSAQLNDTKSTLGLLMNDPELYNRLNRVTADIDSLIIDIKKNPKRYISIKLL